MFSTLTPGWHFRAARWAAAWCRRPDLSDLRQLFNSQHPQFPGRSALAFRRLAGDPGEIQPTIGVALRHAGRSQTGTLAA